MTHNDPVPELKVNNHSPGISYFTSVFLQQLTFGETTHALTATAICPQHLQTVIKMATIRFVVIFISLVIQTVVADDLGPRNSHRRLLTCADPEQFVLAATLDVQTYYPSYCSEAAISEIGSFLYTHFDAYSAYDTTVGAIEVIPVRETALTCSGTRRNLLETSDDIKDKSSSSMHRNLYTGGFVFKVPVKCKNCSLDNADARRRLTNTSPITILIKTDKYPSEFSFRIKKGTSTVYMSSGISAPNSEYTGTFLFEPSTTYTVFLKDSFGDGICCQHGKGSFTISAGTNMNGITLLHDKGDFGFSRTITFVTPPTPVAVTSSSSLIDIGQLQMKYSEYLTYYLQQSYHTDFSKCLYGTFPSVSVALKETTYTDALSSC